MDRWPPLFLKTTTTIATMGNRPLPDFVGRKCRYGGQTLALFHFALNFFLAKFFNRHFLDFGWSTMISEHFEKVKHQFVSPDMLTKWLLVSKKDNLSHFILWIEVFLIVYSYDIRENHLHGQPFKSRSDFMFYCLTWKSSFSRFYSHMTSHWQMPCPDIFNR